MTRLVQGFSVRLAARALSADGSSRTVYS